MAKTVRTVLGDIRAFGARLDAMDRNPVRDTAPSRRIYQGEPKAPDIVELRRLRAYSPILVLIPSGGKPSPELWTRPTMVIFDDGMAVADLRAVHEWPDQEKPYIDHRSRLFAEPPDSPPGQHGRPGATAPLTVAPWRLRLGSLLP
jgi:hypothetical protein